MEAQPFGTMRLLPFALSAGTRIESAQLLNRVLADTTILHAIYKKHHWLVAGPTPYQLHLMFDKHAGEQLELVDLLAELTPGRGVAVGDPRHAPNSPGSRRPPRRGSASDDQSPARGARGDHHGRPYSH